MNNYIKEVDALELEINTAIAEYVATGDVSYLVKANHYTHQLDAERRHHDSI